LISYPGQDPSIPGQTLTYEGALGATIEVCRVFRPRLIVTRSFGCQVVLGAVAAGGEWVATCEYVTLWGPCLLGSYQRLWPTMERRQKEIEGYAKYGTSVDSSLFDSPAVETLIREANCNVRLSRGTLDYCNLREDLEYLASLHRRFQPHRWCEIVEVEGLEHTVRAEEMDPTVAMYYFNALFGNVGCRVSQGNGSS
jgi:hypothetical protein